MTAPEILAEIALAGKHGVERDSLILVAGFGVVHTLDHLENLGLVHSSELPYWAKPRYFASTERGYYKRAVS